MLQYTEDPKLTLSSNLGPGPYCIRPMLHGSLCPSSLILSTPPMWAHGAVPPDFVDSLPCGPLCSVPLFLLTCFCGRVAICLLILVANKEACFVPIDSLANSTELGLVA